MSKEREPQLTPLTIEQVAAHAKEVILRDSGHMPTIFVQSVGKEPQVGELQEFPETHEDRMKAMILVGMKYGEEPRLGGNLSQVFFVCEAWMSSAPDDKALVLPPSKDPNRKEVLIVSGIDLNTMKSTLIVNEMIRGENEKLESLELMTPEPITGDAVNARLLTAFLYGFYRTAGS